MEGFLSSVLEGLALRLPFLLACAAGIALVALRWRRHPKASLLALLGLAALVLSSLGSSVVYDLINRFAMRGAWDPGRMTTVYRAVSFLFYLVDAIAVGLLAVAVVTDRSTVRTEGGG